MASDGQRYLISKKKKKKKTNEITEISTPPAFSSIHSKSKEVRSVDDPFIKNKTPFQLGMILLELESEDSLARIAERGQINGSDTQDSREFRAHRVQVPESHDGGTLRTDYGRIVRMCLDCDFGLGLNESLDDRRLQKTFYPQLICQF